MQTERPHAWATHGSPLRGMPAFRAMRPAPKIAITRFGAGVHSFWKPEKDLPVGIVPSVIKSWKEAVARGYFL